MCYDMTVRNNKNKIIQFTYGDDNINPTKVENQRYLAFKCLLKKYIHIFIFHIYKQIIF